MLTLYALAHSTLLCCTNWIEKEKKIRQVKPLQRERKSGQFRNDLLPIVLPPPSLRLTALPPTVFCAVCRRYFGFCSGTPLYFAGIVPYFTASEARNLSSTARLLDCSDSSCSLFSPRLCQFVHDISTVHGSGRCYGIDVTVSFLRSLRSAVF